MNCLPVDLINGYQHNVLNFTYAYTFAEVVKQSKKLTVSGYLWYEGEEGRGVIFDLFALAINGVFISGLFHGLFYI